MFNLEGINALFLALSSAGLAEGTNANTFQIANTVTYLSDGVFKSKSATDNLAFSSGHTALPASSLCLFGVWLDASGNVTTNQGPIVTSDLTRAPVPKIEPEKTLIGLIKVETSSSGAFTPGSTDLGAAGVTDTYFNCSVMPGEAK